MMGKMMTITGGEGKFPRGNTGHGSEVNPTPGVKP